MGWRNHADPVIEGKLYLGKLVFFFLYVISVFPEIKSEHTASASKHEHGDKHSADEEMIFAKLPKPTYKRQLSTALQFV